MGKSLKTLLLGVFFIIGLFSLAPATDESLTITTYYPSPYGSYKTLTTNLIITTRYSAPSTTIDWSQGNVQSLTLTATPTTITLTNGSDGGKYILILKQDATGSRTVTWAATGATVRWSGGTPPTLTTGVNKTDYVGFIYNNATGTPYYDGIAERLNF